MSIPKRFLLLPIIGLLALPACKENTATTSSPEDAGAAGGAGALNHGPAIAEVDYDSLQYVKGSFYKDDAPFNGRAIQKHTDGTLKSRYHFVEGQFDGMVEEWYENGQRSGLKHYKEGMRHGITVYWDENGKMTKQVRYENDDEKEVKEGDELPKNIGL